jgi:hypothetical protein
MRSILVAALVALGLGAHPAIADDVSSRYWRKGARYLFDTKPKLLQIQLANAGVVQLSLATGSHKYFAAGTAAPKLTRAEDAEVWPINLRFSSITDVLAKK